MEAIGIGCEVFNLVKLVVNTSSSTREKMNKQIFLVQWTYSTNRIV